MCGYRGLQAWLVGAVEREVVGRWRHVELVRGVITEAQDVLTSVEAEARQVARVQDPAFVGHPEQASGHIDGDGEDHASGEEVEELDRLFLSQPALPTWSDLVNPLYVSALFVAFWICSLSAGSDG